MNGVILPLSEAWRIGFGIGLPWRCFLARRVYLQVECVLVVNRKRSRYFSALDITRGVLGPAVAVVLGTAVVISYLGLSNRQASTTHPLPSHHLNPLSPCLQPRYVSQVLILLCKVFYQFKDLLPVQRSTLQPCFLHRLWLSLGTFVS